ncbi:glucose-6-phosphatase a, catalytic subunit, tandem duplicate 1 [Paramormyrops kingsleyae]|nr:glucose-6-phosphatase-like [Paramormyrops kingsleyae]XP_023670055.1 glucose-6-phosphatase-like [Paramormyrops kingsleyae]XP_023670056.1 glucose-6-phosphatase-like [Paramormyrops kingsleyae]XP_023670057.1 glucose-6-phosphatase-like [Paramormyrops kingsleyae]XP_023670058.1 glucose-6-phosphatase-like [Paramormyrops kingsleyae]XP_023670059.1 glucose-6-phosphatase-like [Paramormyrops kingsleyae]XP_023670060.1 glucose-6-phosphatase-like [Paramormyrops kingsleyae]XP_023670061.1 glucose-6-phospha
MDLLHGIGVDLVLYLQANYRNYESVFHLASSLADLHTPIFIFFPVWFHLHQKVGINLIWVAVVGDWLNLVFKWVLFGERPYWWVHETQFYGSAPPPVLQQFPITCETGPGSPSGHAMGLAGVWHVMVTAVLAANTERTHSALFSWVVRLGLWMVLAIVILLVCMSRVYVAAHFPHQVITGVIAGMIVAEVFNRVQWIYSASLKKYLYVTLFLLTFALGFYVLLKALGVDLLWTLDKAKRWCIRPEWVHMDTTPFASLMRNMGTLFGLGLGLHSPLCEQKKEIKSASFRLGCIIFSLLLLQLLDTVSLPSKSNILFYLLSFCKSAAAPFITAALVPGCLSVLFLSKNVQRNL